MKNKVQIYLGIWCPDATESSLKENSRPGCRSKPFSLLWLLYTMLSLIIIFTQILEDDLITISPVPMSHSIIPVCALRQQQQKLVGQSSQLLPAVYSCHSVQSASPCVSHKKETSQTRMIGFCIFSGKTICYNEVTSLHFLLIFACDNYFCLPALLPLSQK